MSQSRRPSYQTFLPEACRPGVLGAIHKIVTSIRDENKRTVSIVLPPRYGKSNVIRQSILELYETGVIGPAIVLAPWQLLRDQICKAAKISKMCEQHKTHLSPRPTSPVCLPVRTVPEPKFYQQTEPHIHWWGMTLSLATRAEMREVVLGPAATLCASERRPMVIFIDESHQICSGPRGWGLFADEMRKAGAIIVLLTGTPERPDNTAPFGFEVSIADRTEVSFRRSERIDETHRLVEEVVGEDVRYKLVPDFEVSLSTAWTDGYILQIQHRYIAFSADDNPISDLTKKELKRALSVGLKSPSVITLAVSEMLNELRLRRHTQSDAGSAHGDTAAMVIVGSDDDEYQDEDGRDDWHARAVKREIERQSPKYFGKVLKVVIATLVNDGEDGEKSSKRIEAFVGDEDTGALGVGDILIVKRMGSVGLDAPRIKVGLYLSTNRKKSSVAQTLLRLATTYEGVKSGTWILPREPIMEELWTQIVTMNGGEFTRTENETVIDSFIVEDDENGEEPPVFIPPLISDPVRAGSIDIRLRLVGVDIDLLVDKVLVKNPSLAIKLTRRDIADLVENGTIQTENYADIEAITPVYDIDADITSTKQRINDIVDDLASREVPYVKGDPGCQWPTVRRRIMAIAKDQGGILCNLHKCTEISKLKKTLAWLETEQRRGPSVLGDEMPF